MTAAQCFSVIYSTFFWSNTPWKILVKDSLNKTMIKDLMSGASSIYSPWTSVFSWLTVSTPPAVRLLCSLAQPKYSADSKLRSCSFNSKWGDWMTPKWHGGWSPNWIKCISKQQQSSYTYYDFPTTIVGHLQEEMCIFLTHFERTVKQMPVILPLQQCSFV